jgi:enterochelin esterase family protein
MRRVLELVRTIEREPARSIEALTAFVSENRFPVLDGDNATFFYWNRERPADAVYLRHWVFGLESRQPLRRIEGTDAWYLPLDLPGKARVEYKFEVVRHNHAEWMRDPLNPLEAHDPFGSNSVCTMPGYVVPSFVHEQAVVRRGTVETVAVPSAVFGDTRQIRVYLPAEYKVSKRYPLLICHDGNDYLRFAAMRPILDNLIHHHEVAPLVVAFTSGVDRNREYGANDRQVTFLVDELLPFLRRTYAVRDSHEATGLMGASFGGVSSLYTAWKRPGVFNRLFLQSGSFVFTDVGAHDRGPLFDPVVSFVNAFREDPGRIDARVFMSCGIFESLIYYNRSLVTLLRDSGIDVRFVESQDGHNWIGWRDRLRDGLTWLFPGHLWFVYE